MPNTENKRKTAADGQNVSKACTDQFEVIQPQAEHSPLPKNNPNKNYAMYRAGAWTAKDSEREMLRLNNRVIEIEAQAQALVEALRELSDQTQLARKYIILDDDNGLAAYHATAKAWNEAREALANWEAAK